MYETLKKRYSLIIYMQPSVKYKVDEKINELKQISDKKLHIKEMIKSLQSDLFMKIFQYNNMIGIKNDEQHLKKYIQRKFKSTLKLCKEIKKQFDISEKIEKDRFYLLDLKNEFFYKDFYQLYKI